MNTPLVGPDRHLNYAEVEASIVQQLHDHITKEAHSKACVVGVSGGIDSAVVATLCAKTKLTTVLTTLPIHQTKAEVDRAQELIETLQATYPHVIHQHIDLTASFEQAKRDLVALGYTEKDLYMSLVNTRSRLRMTYLYALTPVYNGLVIGTGNLIEDFGICFFTKYGDGGVDYSPIGGLLKSEVRKLAKQLIHVPESIILAQPTDGLHDNGATDEDQLKATYDELEWARAAYEQEKRPHNYPIGSRAYEVMSIYTYRHVTNKHKTHMPPVAKIPMPGDKEKLEK